MYKRFNDKVVIITGASSGIGKLTAIEFGKEGAKVVVAARRIEKSQDTVQEIKNKGGEAIFIKTDVTDPESIEKLVDKTLNEYGSLNYAFNNAGISGDIFKSTAEHTEENWNKVIQTNLTGVWRCMKHEIPAIIKSGGGAIVNSSSTYSLTGSMVGHVPYVASKHGVIGLTKTAAYEYASKGIRINAIVPGFVHSEMIDPAIEAYPEEIKKSINNIPLKRSADTIEIVRGVIWLCSDDASYMTGQSLTMDGGWFAK
jgi:NAD(P)-dependent dehydrogenase (short-subunit alcohol dehydrogenase family)